MKYKYKTINKETFINEYKEDCPSNYDLEEECGLESGHYDCDTCWDIALKNVTEIEVKWCAVEFKFKERC